MADLSNLHPDFISQNPLPQLSQLRERLQRLESSLKSDSSTSDTLNYNIHQAIIPLIQLLKEHPVASRLHNPASNLPLASELATILTHLKESNEDTFDYGPYRELSEQVVSESADHTIWETAFGLIAKTKPKRTTPPITPHRSASGANQSLKQTPHSYSTSGLESTSESKDDIFPVLKKELSPSLRLDIPDFVDAVFGHVPHLEKLADTAFNSSQEGDVQEGDDIRYTKDAGWSGWPKDCRERDVITWLGKVMSRLITLIQHEKGYVANRRRVYSTPNKFILGSPVKRKMDTGIEKVVEGVGGPSQDDPPHWDRMLVVGELKSNAAEDNHELTFLGLAQYAREVFRTQDRRFVLGFTLCGSMMRLWHFDRSGSSGSTSFDINEDGLLFVRIMLGYYLMNDEQLGFDPTIRSVDGKRWIDITRHGKTERLFIEEDVRNHAAIVGRATRCWKAYSGEGTARQRLVVKDSWQFEERAEEGELIQEATSQSVSNIAQYYHHETVQCSNKDDDILGNVRKGMMQNCGRQTFTQRSNTQLSASRFRGRTTSSQSQSGSKLRKRVSSPSSSPSPLPSSKRSRTSHSESPTDPAKHNRIHRRVVTTSPGKPLNEASSCSAIVTAFIGAIAGKYFWYQRRGCPADLLGHESLLKAGILHRDISTGNIMLTETEDKGFLIDLDLAIKIEDQKPSGAPSRTGTKVFMAIGALLGRQHTFMHDLESFFWVFYWICMHYEGLNEKGKMNEQRTEFEGWNWQKPKALARSKGGTITAALFSSVDDDVTKYCTPLLPCLKELHKVLFPGYAPREDQDRSLYAKMIQVFERTKREIM